MAGLVVALAGAATGVAATQAQAVPASPDGAVTSASEEPAAPAWRPFEPRLSRLAFAPWPAARDAAALASELALARALDAQADAADPATAARGAWLGRIRRGDLEGAMRFLEARLALDDPEADRSDLAALHLARALAGPAAGQAFEGLVALDLLTSGPRTTPAAAFNYALALETIGLRARAGSAWSAALAGEQDAGWAAEERLHRDRLAEPTLEDQWRAAARRLAEPGIPIDGADRDLALRLPAESFDLAVDELLPAWAQRCAAGSSAVEKRCLALLDRVRELDAATPGAGLAATADLCRDRVPRRREELARGLLDLHAGRLFADRREAARARESFARAATVLARAGSPLAPWAQYGAAAALLHAGRRDALLDDLARIATADPRLSASMARTRGTVATFEERLPDSELEYRRAVEGFDRAADLYLSGEAEGYLGEVFRLQGRFEAEWSARERSLRRLAQWPGRSAWPDALNYAAYAAASEGLPFAALELASTSLAAQATVAEDPVRAVETRLFQARAARRAGRPSEGDVAFAAAAAAVPAVTDAALRQRLAADVAFERGVEAAGVPPAERERRLGAAIDRYRRLGVQLFLMQAYEARARARLESGRVAAAEADLRRGLEAHARAVREFHDPSDALRVAESGQQLYDALAELRLARRNDPWGALDLVDRARDLLLAGPTSDALDWCAVSARLPVGAAVLTYAWLPERLLVAVIRPSGVRLAVLAAEPNSLASDVRRFRGALAAGDDATVHALAASLYDRLVGPVANDLTGVRSLLVVPDRALALVPFAALLDGARSRFLVEDMAVAHELSVRAWLRAAAAEPAPHPWAAVALAPEGRGAAAGEGALPGARAEAEEVARALGGDAVVGQSADRAAFLRALARSDVVHFAGHANAEPEAPERARLWLAGGMGELEPFFARELGGRDLSRVELVVLSGCETALPSARRSIASDGIAAAFLERGVRAVVATAWRSEDAASVRLMQYLHQALARGEDAASALRVAQLQLLHGDDTTLRRPSAWAFAQLTGLAVRQPPRSEGGNR